MLAILKKNLFFQYLEWQFFDAPKEIIKGWRNFLLFNLHYFSTPLLIKTFFSYWHRYQWSYGKRFDPKVYFEAFFSNLISRCIGAIIRSFFIILGAITEIIIFFLGLIVLLIWLGLPLIIILGIYYGSKLLF